MASINWAQYTERARGHGHPTLADVVNRPLREVLQASGLDPDEDFVGFVSAYPGAMPVFDVRAFGAVATLGSFQTVAIQAAITAARDAGGGVVYVPAGSYACGALTLYPKVRLVGAGGTAIGSTEATTLYQASAAGTHVVLEGEVGNDSGGGIEDIRLSTSPVNTTNAGGILIRGMSRVSLRRVSLSGYKTFGLRFAGGTIAGGKMYSEAVQCSVSNMQNATDACYSVLADDASSRPDDIKLSRCHASSNSVWLEVLRGAFNAPDSIKAEFCSFIASASVANCLDLRGVNAYIIGCRLETVGGGATLSVNLDPPAGSQPAATFRDNNWAAPGGRTYSDTGTGTARSRIEGDFDGVRTTQQAPRYSVFAVQDLDGAAANITPDAAAGSHRKVRVTNGGAFTINAPSNPEQGQELLFDIYNNSGGAMGAITWNAVFKLAGAFTNPGNGNHRMIRFVYDGTGPAWRETFRSAADQAN